MKKCFTFFAILSCLYVLFTGNVMAYTDHPPFIRLLLLMDSPPVLSAGGTLNFTENDAASVIDTTITLRDSDSTYLESAVIEISWNYVYGEDVLGFTNANGISGAWDAGTGRLTLTGKSSLAEYLTALKSVTYINTSENPLTSARTVTWKITDGDSYSTPVSSTINITSVNDAPVPSAGGTINFTEGDTAAVIDSTITLIDLDDTDIESAVVEISSNYVNGEDVLSFTDANGISGTWDAETGRLTLTGSSSLANYLTALKSVEYINTSANPSTAARTVTWKINDGDMDSIPVSSTINISETFNAPSASKLSYSARLNKINYGADLETDSANTGYKLYVKLINGADSVELVSKNNLSVSGGLNLNTVDFTVLSGNPDDLDSSATGDSDFTESVKSGTSISYKLKVSSRETMTAETSDGSVPAAPTGSDYSQGDLANISLEYEDDANLKLKASASLTPTEGRISASADNGANWHVLGTINGAGALAPINNNLPIAQYTDASIVKYTYTNDNGNESLASAQDGEVVGVVEFTKITDIYSGSDRSIQLKFSGSGATITENIVNAQNIITVDTTNSNATAIDFGTNTDDFSASAGAVTQNMLVDVTGDLDRDETGWAVKAHTDTNSIVSKDGGHVLAPGSNLNGKFYFISDGQVGPQGITNIATWDISSDIDSSDIPYISYRDPDNGSKATVRKFSAGSWVAVGSAGFSPSNVAYPIMKLDSNDVPYVVFRDVSASNKSSVMKFDGSSWGYVGAAGISSGICGFTDIAFDSSNTPYIVYEDNGVSDKACVKKFDGTNWVNIGVNGISAGSVGYLQMVIDSSDKIYVSYRDEANGSKLTVLEWSGAAWDPVGGSAAFTTSSIGYDKLTLDKNDVLHVIFGDNATSKVHLMKYDGGWQTLRETGQYMGDGDVAFDSSNNPVIVYGDYNGGTYIPKGERWDGSQWVDINSGSSLTVDGSYYYVMLELDSNDDGYLTYQDKTNGNRISVVRF